MYTNSNGVFSFSPSDIKQFEDVFDKCFSNSEKPGSANNKSQENLQLKNVPYQENSPERDFLNGEEFFEKYFSNSNDPYYDNKPQENQQLKNVSYQKKSPELFDRFEDDEFFNDFLNSCKPYSDNNKPQENQQQNVSYQDSPERLDRFDGDEFFNNFLNSNELYSDNNNKILSIENNSNDINIYSDSDQIAFNDYINTTGFKETNKRVNVDFKNNGLKESSNYKKQKIFNNSLKENATNNDSLEKEISKIINNTKLNQDDVVFGLFKILSPNSRYFTVIAKRIQDYVNNWSGKEIIFNNLQNKMYQNVEISKCVKENEKLFLDEILNIFNELNENNNIIGSFSNGCKAICSRINPWLVSRGEEEITVRIVTSLIKKRKELEGIKETLKFFADEYYEKVNRIFHKKAAKEKSVDEAAIIMLDDVNEFRKTANQKKIELNTLINSILYHPKLLIIKSSTEVRQKKYAKIK